MATKYGKTWWGEQWLGALKNIDYSNRLPRGASYARNGMVQEINFSGNIISAKVKGSRRTPYSETIKLPGFSSKDIDKLVKLIQEQPVVLSKLFNRQLDESLAKMAEEAGMPLFPKQWKDLKMNCSCPDWAVPCKHLAAVIYKTSMEIDNNPFLVFSLHGVDLMAELEKRGITAADSTEMMEVENTSAVYATMEQMQLRKVPEQMPDYTLLSELTLPLSNLLPSSPAFCHHGDFQQTYQKELLYISKVATKVLQDKQKLFLSTSGKTLNKRDVVSVDDIRLPLLQQLLDINIDFLRDYDDSIVALRSVVICALQLIAHGCIVPQIYYDLVIIKGRGRVKAKEEKEYHIIWQPAMIDDATRSIIGRLGQSKELVSKMITSLVPMLSHESKDELFYDLFFKAEFSRFNGIGETNTPGGIRSWLDHVAERFRKVTAPFLMRRLKTDKSIISDLPDKIERNELASLTPEQAALYQETVNKCMAVIERMEGEDHQTLFKRQGLILQMMLALKQICNHPTQYLKDNRMDATLSGKTEMLLDMLRSIIDADEKVLIFTQFREMGDLLQHFIRTTLDEEPMFYHGGCSLKQRQEMVDRFQNNRNDRIFILSLKAAGTGLNLTAATHVIHYDLWWNPAVEAQATDRAYRIGQHKNVQVHRFITQNTFEERIDAMIQEKKHLADLTVSTGESWIGKLSNKELHEIFG